MIVIGAYLSHRKNPISFPKNQAFLRCRESSDSSNIAVPSVSNPCKPSPYAESIQSGPVRGCHPGGHRRRPHPLPGGREDRPFTLQRHTDRRGGRQWHAAPQHPQAYQARCGPARHPDADHGRDQHPPRDKEAPSGRSRCHAHDTQRPFHDLAALRARRQRLPHQELRLRGDLRRRQDRVREGVLHEPSHQQGPHRRHQETAESPRGHPH